MNYYHVQMPPINRFGNQTLKLHNVCFMDQSSSHVILMYTHAILCYHESVNANQYTRMSALGAAGGETLGEFGRNYG